MANTEYITAPVYNDGTKASVKWYDATITGHDGDIYFPRGANVTWKNTSTGGGASGDIFSSGGISLGSSSSGKSWDFTYKQVTSKNGLFPLMNNITGFQFDFQQTSTAGHAYWLKRAGIETCNATGGNNIRWSTYDRSKRGDFDWHTVKYNFSSDDNNAFRNLHFYRVWFHLSTAGGSFTANNTYVNIRNFKLLYNNGSGSSNLWVVGKYRPKEKAGEEAIQGK